MNVKSMFQLRPQITKKLTLLFRYIIVKDASLMKDAKNVLFQKFSRNVGLHTLIKPHDPFLDPLHII